MGSIPFPCLSFPTPLPGRAALPSARCGVLGCPWERNGEPQRHGVRRARPGLAALPPAAPVPRLPVPSVTQPGGGITRGDTAESSVTLSQRSGGWDPRAEL